jgi:hypothetical protein
MRKRALHSCSLPWETGKKDFAPATYAREEESAKATLSAISCEHFTLKHTQQKAAHGSREISSLARTTTIYTYCGTLCTSAFCFYVHKLRCVLAGVESAFIPWCARSLALQLLLCAPAVEYKHTHTHRADAADDTSRDENLSRVRTAALVGRELHILPPRPHLPPFRGAECTQHAISSPRQQGERERENGMGF